jgi:hypothetical protein
MKTYVAEINGRAIFAFRAATDAGAQAWLDIHAIMRHRLEQVTSSGQRVWDGHALIAAREASAAEAALWTRLRDESVGLGATEYPDNITVWLIPTSDETRISNGA